MIALILTGGASSRMGRDKAGLEVEGVPLLQAMVERFRPHFDEVVISVDRPGRFDTFGAREIVDWYPGRGPLAGLHAALAETEADAAFMTAVDLPYADPTLAKRMAELMEPGYDAAVLQRGGRYEPVFAVYRNTVLPFAEKCLKEQRLRFSQFLAAIRIREILPNELEAWNLDRVLFNMNRPDEYKLVQGGDYLKDGPPVLSFVGWSGSGKTTYLERLIPVLKRHGLRLGIIKHDAHKFEIDKPGKDSYRMYEAGGDSVAISSGEKFALIQRRAVQRPLEEVIGLMGDVDLVLTEGYKAGNYLKVEIHRQVTGKPLASAGRTDLAAVVTDERLSEPVPQFGFSDGDLETMADFVLRITGLSEAWAYRGTK